MSDTFALMNVLIKGTAASIKTALEKLELDCGEKLTVGVCQAYG